MKKTIAKGQVNVPVELAFTGQGEDVEVDVIFADEHGAEWRVPAFWAGGTEYRVRFAAPKPGHYTYRTNDGQMGELEIAPYDGGNYLYQHGRLRVAASHRTLEHSDGTPFLWLGDTWWMGLTKRLDWPEGFEMLTADRVAKGFNLVQIVAGPLPNFQAETESWHPFQANEAGWSWEQDWTRINPAFYDFADRRIAYLVENDIVPCIVGMWSFYIGFMGVEKGRKHWRNLIARYAAYPVVWCIAGEVKLPPYSQLGVEGALAKEAVFQTEAWNDVSRYVREIDPYHNPITAHPWEIEGARVALGGNDLLDVDMLQTGHGDHGVLKRTVEAIDACNARLPRMPVINGEPSYEGIMGTAWQEQQRFLFWTSILSGSAGHTYGAQGIWQMSTREEPYSQDWGEGFWREAMHYPGSEQVGLGRRFLERYPWCQFEPRREPDVEKLGRISSFAAGVPGEVWMFYLVGNWADQALVGVRGMSVQIEAKFRAFFFNPRSGEEVEVGVVNPGVWPIPARPTMEDWVLVLEAMQ